ncbi:MAG: phosphatidylserine decarboxylase [Candidatus Babeliales bacterium]
MIDSKGPKETFEYHRWLTFLYGSHVGRVLRFFIARKWFNHLVGLYQDSKLSYRAIEPFIQRHNINMDDFVVPSGGYTSFNQFFIRSLKPGARVIDANQYSVIAPADSRVLVIPRLQERTSFSIKGTRCTLDGLFADRMMASLYNYGTCMIFRLSPADYHRVHFPLQGVPLRARPVHGIYESVNPTVFEAGVQPLIKNERQIILFDTALCDQVAIVLVGALCVGKVITTYAPSVLQEKGNELGYFAFGGSTVVVVFKQGVVTIDPVVSQNSALGIESVISMGQKVATVCH